MEKDSRMSSVKLVLVSQAHSINQYKKFKSIMLKCCTRWFKYDRDLCGLFTHKSVPVIFEPPCTLCGCVCFKCLLVPLICGGNDFEGESSQTEYIISLQYVDRKLKKQEIAKVLM
jgi:hypothetical protein